MKSIISLQAEEVAKILDVNEDTKGKTWLYYNNIKIFINYIESQYGRKESISVDTFISYAHTFFSYCFSRGLSVSSINRHIAAINYYLKSNNVSERIPFFKVTSINRSIDVSYEEKVFDILQKRIKIKDRLIIYLFIYQGFIIEDICNLRTENVDLIENTIVKADKTFKMHPDVKVCYQQFLESRFYKINEGDYVFYYRCKMTPSGISRIISKYELNPRELRNLFYSKLMQLVSKREPDVARNIKKITDDTSELIYNKYIPELEYK